MENIETYILTFLCYTSIHTLRTAYSSAKSDIPADIHLEDTKFMGIVDALMLSFLGLGHFLHAIYPIKKPVKSLWIAMIICAVNYGLIPVFLSWQPFANIYILCVLMSINGFLQSYTWPNLLMIVNSKFDSAKQPILLGFWATNANVGNIIGYLIFMLLKGFDLKSDTIWKIGLEIGAAYALINGLTVCFTISQLPIAGTKELKQKSFMEYCDKHAPLSHIQQNPIDSLNDLEDELLGSRAKSVKSLRSLQEKQHSHHSSLFETKSIRTLKTIRSRIAMGAVKSIRLVDQPQKVAQTPLSIRQVFKDPNVILLTITFSLTKSVIYGIMLWLPNYFKSNQELKPYSEQIPITYDIAAIFGSVGIGYLFKKIQNKGLIMIPFMVVLFICFLLLRFVSFHVVEEFALIALIGFALGGIFNTLSGLVVLELVKVIPENLKSSSLGFYSALTMAAGNFVTAFTQILIGFVIGKSNQEQIFLVFMIYSGVCMVCLILIAIITFQQHGKISKGEVLVIEEVAEDEDEEQGEQRYPQGQISQQNDYKQRVKIDQKFQEKGNA